jgi:hypothetical protein
MLHPSPVKTNPHTRESLPKESPRQWGGKYQFEIIMDVRNDGHLILHRRADHVAVESFSQVGNKFPIIPGDVVTSVNNRSVELMQYDEGASTVAPSMAVQQQRRRSRHPCPLCDLPVSSPLALSACVLY